MFEITINGKTLYHPNSTECNVTNAVIHEVLNDAGYMDATIPFSNPMYDDIEERKGEVIVYKDNKERWYGEVRDISVDFSKNKSLYIVGEAAYLNDTVQPQRLIKGTKYQILQEILNHHNSMCGKGKEFQPGAIGHNANVYMEIVIDWEYSLDAIRNHLCEEEEYFKIRHINGVRYVDIMPLEVYGRRSEQTIMFGENLLDYSEESSGEKIATVCIPLGETVDGGIEGYDNYLTCASVNGGKNYVELPGAINRLGRITKVVHFNEFVEPQALLTAAINYLQSAQFAQLTLTLSAVDLSILHSDIDEYAIGDYIRAICEPMGMDAWFPVRERETDLLDLANNEIVIGAEGVKSITTQNSESIMELQQKMPNKDSILKAALKNASEMINANGQKGYVSIQLNENGDPYEIIIMNADSIEQSTQAWRWNLAGFGHGTKEAGAPLFEWETDVAITMDGGIVATYITSGILTGIEINNGNKTFHVDSKGVMTAQKGVFGGSLEAATGTFKGELKAATGTISDGTGTLSLSGGSLHMKNGNEGGPGVFADGPGNMYSCWGAKNSAARNKDGTTYREVATMDIIRAGENASDKRLKKDIKLLDYETSHRLIMGIIPKTFRFKDIPKELNFGVIAQDVREIEKELGIDTENNRLCYTNEASGFYSVDYSQLIAPMIKVIQKQQEDINLLMKGVKHD